MFTLRKAIATILALIAQQAAMDKNFKPLGEITGADTTVERSFNAMVTTEKDFQQLWAIHKELLGEPPVTGTGLAIDGNEVPRVDFTKNVVIAYFAGQTSGIMGYSVVDVDTKGKTNIVRIEAQKLNGQAGIAANTYGMWVFPRPKKAVELELVVGWDNNKQPVTRKIAKFEPPKAVKQ